MREILFRGKRVDNGEWVYGFPYETYRNCHSREVIACPPNEFGQGKYIEVVRGTLSQFIGLADKNGRKIFEGDIVEYKEENGEIVYDTETAMYIVSFDTWCTDFDHIYSREIEIIGNIHDNPELLGGVQE